MKSEHRHDLKTNDLAQWIANLPQWAKENLRIIIYVSVVAVLVIASAVFHWYRRNVESVNEKRNVTKLIAQLPQDKLQILQAQSQGFDNSFMLMRTASKLGAVAQNIKDDTAAAFALIKQAEALRTELHYRLETTGEQEIASQIDKAKAAYAEALPRASSSRSLMAEAKLGMGLCEEECGNFAQARNVYRQITEANNFEGTTAAAAAQLRLKTINDYEQKLTFKAVQKQAPPEAVQPEIVVPPIEVNSLDINLFGP